jgi:hypothetical protein
MSKIDYLFFGRVCKNKMKFKGKYKEYMRKGSKIYNKINIIDVNDEKKLLNGIECLFTLWIIIKLVNENERRITGFDDKLKKEIKRYDLELVKELMDNNMKILCESNKTLNYDDIWSKYNLLLKRDRIQKYLYLYNE